MLNILSMLFHFKDTFNLNVSGNPKSFHVFSGNENRSCLLVFPKNIIEQVRKCSVFWGHRTSHEMRIILVQVLEVKLMLVSEKMANSPWRMPCLLFSRFLFKSSPHNVLTHWGRDKMADISQTIFSNIFSSKKMFEFRLKFHWNLFLRVQLTKIPALFQIMAWRRPGDKTLSEAMLVSLLTHKCFTRPQWVKCSYQPSVSNLKDEWQQQPVISLTYLARQLDKVTMFRFSLQIRRQYWLR